MFPVSYSDYKRGHDPRVPQSSDIAHAKSDPRDPEPVGILDRYTARRYIRGHRRPSPLQRGRSYKAVSHPYKHHSQPAQDVWDGEYDRWADTRDGVIWNQSLIDYYHSPAFNTKPPVPFPINPGDASQAERRASKNATRHENARLFAQNLIEKRRVKEQEEDLQKQHKYYWGSPKVPEQLKRPFPKKDPDYPSYHEAVVAAHNTQFVRKY